MITALKAIGGPGSIGFLSVALAIGLVLGRFGPRLRRLSRSWILTLLLVYLLLGVPRVATVMANGLTGYPPETDRGALAGARALVVLHGDNAQGRVREATRVFETIAPPIVVVCGSGKFLQAIVDAGIPQSRILHDSSSTTTQEQIATVAEWIKRDGSPPAVLIASRLHMPRVAALADAHGFRPLLAPSSLDTEPPTSGLWQFLPTYASLLVSRDALYEYAALAYYRWRGWIR
jgi:uncharacterized SAM-binding protein YcdF (DUF218 family)